MREPPKWYDANATDNPPWIKALAEVRHLACREGWRYQHVQAIIVAIDQYPQLTVPPLYRRDHLVVAVCISESLSLRNLLPFTPAGFLEME